MSPRTLFAAGATAVGLLMGGFATSAAAEAPEATEYVATFDVHGESYKVRLVEQKDIDDARELLHSDDPGSLTPNGALNWGVVDVNAPYQWSVNPNNFAFTGPSPEACDGWPSWVDGPDWGNGYFCPWDAVIVALDPITR